MLLVLAFGSYTKAAQVVPYVSLTIPIDIPGESTFEFIRIVRSFTFRLM